MKSLDQMPPTWSLALPGNDGASNGCDSSRFDCIAQDAVLDRETGLVWQRSYLPLPVNASWEEALVGCWEETDLGRGGWRLPEIHELMTVLEGRPAEFPLVPTAGAPGLPAPVPIRFLTATRHSSGVHAVSQTAIERVWTVLLWPAEQIDVQLSEIGPAIPPDGFGRHRLCVRGPGAAGS